MTADPLPCVECEGAEGHAPGCTRGPRPDISTLRARLKEATEQRMDADAELDTAIRRGREVVISAKALASRRAKKAEDRARTALLKALEDRSTFSPPRYISPTPDTDDDPPPRAA